MKPKPHGFDTSRADVIPVATGFGSILENVSPLRVIIASCALSVPGTSSAEPTRLWEEPYVCECDATASGLAWEERSEALLDVGSTRQAVSMLRHISGLTWEQLGELFDVSRRSVHFWASGKPLNAGNEKRLMQVLDVVAAADRGDARSTRVALFEVKDGTTAFGLLAAERFEEARALLGVGPARFRPALTKLSSEAIEARKPLPPEELVDAQHDRVHRDRGRSRAARTVRNKRRGSD